jgi:hypothetical protein
MRTAFALVSALALVGCSTVPEGYRELDFGVCRRISSHPQLIEGKGRFHVYQCDGGQLIFDPADATQELL